MKRPTDAQIRYAKILLWALLVIAWVLVFGVQKLELENSLFWFDLTASSKEILSYVIMSLGFIPLILWGLDINLLSRWYTKIFQIISWIVLIIISGLFIETATLSADIIYFLLGLIVFIAGVTGKAITKKGLKHGQKITKIRV